MTLDRTTVFANPMGPGPLLFYSMSGREALGQPFVYEVDLLSTDANIDLSQLLGQPASVALELNDGTIRYFHGIVTHFAITGEHGRFVRYRAILRPWLWLLSNRVNSRIFQNKTVPDVLKILFREYGFTDFKELLSSEYRSWEFLVQYRESDLNFVSRLMEQEGIYYFFKHEEGKHTLILSDSYPAHGPAPTNEELPYYPPLERERRDVEHVNGWLASRRIRSGAYAARDYNFKRPSTLLGDQRKAPNNHAHDRYELFDYPGDFLEAAEATQQAQVRFEEHQVEYDVVEGSATARSLFAGALFTLTDFPREDQNKEYLIIEANYELRASEYESGKNEDIEPDYRLRFRAIDGKQQFRTARMSKKPVVEGPQTAVVVGKGDQEIWTDEYGRVKLQFFWDREGQFDENSSCFVRVAQIWAGSKWGGIHLPRIGQEVIVDFLEGDPDRPIITGRVYNADNMPPYTLPDNQTQSGIKSRSTKGGNPDNFNELRFEDKKGEEQVYIQAEKDMVTLVKHDQTNTIENDRKSDITANDSVGVGGNRSLTVGGTNTVTVTKADTELYNNTRTTTVVLADVLTIGQAHTGTYGAARTLTIKGPDSTTVTAGDRSVAVTGSYNSSATVQFQAKNGENNELLLKGSQAKLKNEKCTVELNGGKVTISASEEISLKVGESSITIKSDGTIAVSATQTSTISGAGGSCEYSPSGSKMHGAQVAINGDATVQVAAALVKVN